ncbi:MAG: YcxB family protein [Ruminococcus sp.]|nr:YcxB family protein [Ruminococcus sp.]
MNENYRLVKDYSIPLDTFSDAYRSYQKKFIYPKNYIFMAIFGILAIDFIVAAVKEPSNVLAYLLIMVCLAMMFREWFNPRKIRNNIIDTVKELGNPVYRLGVADDYIEISTISDGGVDKSASDASADELDYNEQYDPLPEKTTFVINDQIKTLEYDRYFLLLNGRMSFYIIPKEGFTDSEMEVIRSINR